MYSKSKNLLSKTFIMFFLFQMGLCSANPFSVTNGKDSGVGSLRQAILDLNSTRTNASSAGSNTITFNAVHPEISLASDLKGGTGANGDGGSSGGGAIYVDLGQTGGGGGGASFSSNAKDASGITSGGDNNSTGLDGGASSQGANGGGFRF